MKISLLVHDLSTNSIVRTYPIAKVLERKHEVEIIGPVFGSEIYAPYKSEFTFKTVSPPTTLLSVACPYIARLLKHIDGDAIYAFKPMISSFGLGLVKKKFTGKPLILDIEDLDGFFPRTAWGKFAYRLGSNYSIKGYLYIRGLQKAAHISDHITVGSDKLQKMFGGTKLPHGTDCNLFNPKKFDQETCRKKAGFGGKSVILFSGTPAPHKGLKELANAVKSLKRKDLEITVAGPKNNHLERLMQKHAFIRHLGLLPHEKMPELLCASDIVALPQKDVEYARAQVPGKVFEAMAMGKPIIASRVSDLPKILAGCGRIVEPDNFLQLAESIKCILSNRQEARKMGKSARKRCLKKYSWNAMGKILENIFEKYE